MVNRLQEHLERAGLTINQLAVQIGFSWQRTRNLIRSDKISPHTRYGTLKKLARALGVKIDDLES